MALLPAADNDYHGSRFAVWFLWFQIALVALAFWLSLHERGVSAPRS